MATRYDVIIYLGLTNPYYRLVRVGDGKVADFTNEALSLTTAWADSDQTLTKNTTIGGIPITLPSWLPTGDYDLLVYDAAVPADTDTVQLGKRIGWDENRMTYIKDI